MFVKPILSGSLREQKINAFGTIRLVCREFDSNFSYICSSRKDWARMEMIGQKSRNSYSNHKTDNLCAKSCCAEIGSLYALQLVFKAPALTFSDTPERSKEPFFEEVGFLSENWRTHGFWLYQHSVLLIWNDVWEHLSQFDLSCVHIPR